jgi:hypothetical protein
MGRPSKLTAQQWAEIERRLNAGDTAADLAREHSINKSQITRRISQRNATVHNVAKKLAQSHDELAALPLPQQYQAMTLADKLRSISSSLASGAELGAKTAHRLHALANNEISRVDDADPLASIESLKSVGVLTKLANESAQMGMGLLAANREQMRDAERAQAEQRRSVLVVPAVMTDAEWAAEAARLKSSLGSQN